MVSKYVLASVPWGDVKNCQLVRRTLYLVYVRVADIYIFVGTKVGFFLPSLGTATIGIVCKDEGTVLPPNPYVSPATLLREYYHHIANTNVKREITVSLRCFGNGQGIARSSPWNLVCVLPWKFEKLGGSKQLIPCKLVYSHGSEHYPHGRTIFFHGSKYRT